MTVYKVDPALIALSVLLVLTAVFFTFSNVVSGFDAAEVIICSIVLLLAVFNFFSLSFRRLEVEDDIINLYSIYGKKTVDISALEEIGVVLLKVRAVLILADAEKFMFVPSYFKNFGEFTDYLKGKINGELRGHLVKVDAKTIRKKQITLALALAALNVLFIGSAIYNLINN